MPIYKTHNYKSMHTNYTTFKCLSVFYKYKFFFIHFFTETSCTYNIFFHELKLSCVCGCESIVYVIAS